MPVKDRNAFLTRANLVIATMRRRRAASSLATCSGEFVQRQVTEAHFDKYFGINVKGTLFTVQKALPLMPAGAAIVINGSMVSIKGFPAFGVYSATKAALRSFVRTWSVDLKGRNIRVNVVSPGTVITPGYKNSWTD